ncbi:MAG: hypothetical protein US50_C0031G0005 [Candidatus Nomurabacteria bacterium GW2011_GWB1_37_5]|uniref:Uncharacterized protein n=1 Tax=Candidatus Nomurabacteria bacterium GW2011_GWB1_37_5 TaxID=1618742 RepID=A0A0G0H8R4_9BACT|nr:MAG: hypothetical protein US50_C0031G0005 [Candidatus Nomurabacteria bacterium GW2011_GWB1_37_5]
MNSLTQKAYAASVDSLVSALKDQIINPIIKLLFVLAFMYFAWGVMEYIWGASDEKKRTQGQQHMLWGVIGMAIMASALGIVQLIVGTID